MTVKPPPGLPPDTQTNPRPGPTNKGTQDAEQPSLHWIDSQSQLIDCCNLLAQEPYLGVDTEFERIRTYYARLALVQICNRSEVYLIDPLAIEDLSPMWDLLTAQPCIKIFHSAGEDLELINRLAGSPPSPLFDTQVAAALLGGDLSTGYQRLVLAELGAEVDKGASRSDWMKRPLSERQINYAAEDVVHLLPLYERFSHQLKQQGREAWLEADLAMLRAQERLDPDPANLYLKFAGAWQLSPSQLVLLRELLIWRERQARKADVPRGWLIADDTVRDIVYHRPDSLDALSRMSGMQGGTLRRRGERILELIKRVSEIPESDYPPPLAEPPKGQQFKALLADLRGALTQVAESFDVRPELLANKRDLMAVIIAAREGQPIDGIIQGWRGPLLTDALRDVLASHAEIL